MDHPRTNVHDDSHRRNVFYFEPVNVDHIAPPTKYERFRTMLEHSKRDDGWKKANATEGPGGMSRNTTSSSDMTVANESLCG